MKLCIHAVFALLFSALLASLPAHADVHFHVKNCTKMDLEFTTYDGHDKVAQIQYKKFTLRGLKDGTDDVSATKTSCHIGCPWGKPCNSRCKIRLQSDVGRKSKTANVYKDQYIRFTSAEIIPASGKPLSEGHTRTWYTLASEEEKCSDHATDVKQLD